MTYRLGSTSEARLVGVHPQLVDCVRKAITTTTCDFTVQEGARSLAAQKANVAKGVSRTLDSLHLSQADGFAHAVDLVPWVDGKASWDWSGCYQVAVAMRDAAQALSLTVRWGGAWDRTLADLPGDAAAMKRAVDAYGARYRAANPGKAPLLDGPHFELRAPIPGAKP
jgi:peptidoglycan L-alanyl-D-glutamate endopeptidase CwlK